MRRFLPVILMIVALPAPAGASAIKVDVSLTPDTTLPGLPVGLVLVTSNDSDVPTPLPNRVAIFVTNEAGATFVARWSDGRYAIPMKEWTTDATLRGQGRARIEVTPAGNLLGEDALDDPRLNEPGRYQLRLAFGDFVSEVPQLNSAIVTAAPVSLTVSQPSGDDGTIWQAMLRIGDGRWSAAFITSPEGRALIQRVIKEWPHSSYAGWFVTAGVSDDPAPNAVALREWLAQAPHDWFTEWRQLQVAFFEEGAARGRAGLKRDDQQRHIKASRDAATSVMKSTHDEKLLDKAREQLKSLDELSGSQP